MSPSDHTGTILFLRNQKDLLEPRVISRNARIQVSQNDKTDLRAMFLSPRIYIYIFMSSKESMVVIMTIMFTINIEFKHAILLF